MTFYLTQDLRQDPKISVSTIEALLLDTNQNRNLSKKFNVLSYKYEYLDKNKLPTSPQP